MSVRSALAALIATAAAHLLLLAPFAHATRPTPEIRAARVLQADAEADVHPVNTNGSHIVEEGTMRGTLSGTVKAYFNVGATITGTVVVRIAGAGTITARGYGTLHNAHGHLYESFSGSITVTSGTGRYAHIHGHAEFYGTVNRRTEAMQVQTRGTLNY
jgi:hypothetical protein